MHPQFPLQAHAREKKRSMFYFVAIFGYFHEICSDFLRFSRICRKTLQLLEISRFQFNIIMIIPEIHSIFDVIFDVIFDLIFGLFSHGYPAPLAGVAPGLRRGSEWAATAVAGGNAGVVCNLIGTYCAG